MSSGYLLDTNALVYTLDPREPERRERAKEVVRRTALSGSGALPVQALSEFANVYLNKLQPPLQPEEVRTEVERLSSAFPVFPLTPLIVGEALRGVKEHGFSYYDSQIWATARLRELAAVLREDFNSGAVFEGVRFVDPFVPEFEITALE
ncbi:PIN domain nuclease [soil metagenome]